MSQVCGKTEKKNETGSAACGSVLCYSKKKKKHKSEFFTSFFISRLNVTSEQFSLSLL